MLWDVTPPTVTIDQAAEQTDPTNASPITFTVVFSEAVVGFGTGDVAITGTSGGTKTATVTGGPVTFSVAVTGMTTSGTVIASIPAGVTTGLTGNPNAASTSTDDTVTWNRATHLAFAVQPTDTVYGANISPAVTVEVLDANDAVVTESSAPIRLTLTPAGANLHRDQSRHRGQWGRHVLRPDGGPGRRRLHAGRAGSRNDVRGECPVRDVAGTVDRHRQRPNEAVRHDLHVQQHGHHGQRSGARRHGRLPQPAELGGSIDGDRRRQPVCDRPIRRPGHWHRQLRHHVRQRLADRHACDRGSSRSPATRSRTTASLTPPRPRRPASWARTCRPTWTCLARPTPRPAPIPSTRGRSTTRRVTMSTPAAPSPTPSARRPSRSPRTTGPSRTARRSPSQGPSSR